MPTRNRANLLERAVHSVFEQTWNNLELIVVDDASNDSTADVLRILSADYPMTVIHNPEPKGAAASRNIAIEYAHGEFVSGIDDDDKWKPKRIELMMNEFNNNVSAVCSNDQMDFGNKKIVWKKKPVINLQDLLYYNMVGNQVLTRKEYIKEVGGYDESLSSAQDYDLWLRLANHFGPITSVPHTLQVVNMHNDADRITTRETKINGYIACFEKHKSKMNEKQKRYQKYRMNVASGEPVGWLHMLKATPSHLLVKEITRKLFL